MFVSNPFFFVRHGGTAAAAPVSSSTVFVGNLSWGTTSDDLRAFMASLGEVLSAEVQSHADSGRSKGWG